MEEQLCFSGSLLSVSELAGMPLCVSQHEASNLTNVVSDLASSGMVVDKSGASLVPKAINSIGGVDTIAAKNFIAQSKLSFAQAVSNNTNFTVTDLPQSCMKGDSTSIKISENEYTKGVEECKSILFGRLILKKGEKAPTAKQLHETLVPLWKIKNWKISPMGKGFFEFEFSTIEEMRSIWSTGSCNLKFGILRLSQWVPDFCPGAQKQSNAQVWIRFSDLPREYWREKTLIEIACVVGMPITLDEVITYLNVTS